MFISGNIKKRYKDIVCKKWEKTINLMRVVHSSLMLSVGQAIN